MQRAVYITAANDAGVPQQSYRNAVLGLVWASVAVYLGGAALAVWDWTTGLKKYPDPLPPPPEAFAGDLREGEGRDWAGGKGGACVGGEAERGAGLSWTAESAARRLCTPRMSRHSWMGTRRLLLPTPPPNPHPTPTHPTGYPVSGYPPQAYPPAPYPGAGQPYPMAPPPGWQPPPYGAPYGGPASPYGYPASNTAPGSEVCVCVCVCAVMGA
jgi:hypothetical protein